MRTRRGTSLIDLLISMGIITVLFGGVYLVYFSILTSITNIGVRTAASTVIGQEIETVRNLPYDSVGTVGGVPPGVIPQAQSVTQGKFTFILQTTVRNIDDPFDGTLGGNPNDTAPADYKLVSIEASCPTCVTNFVPIEITTTVAPKNLESATQNGSLFIYALDASGVGVPGATVHVVNASVTPSIDLMDTTNASGVLQLVGVPTSTQGYTISVTKDGFSSDRTYPIGAPGNPNPVKPYATVAQQAVTSITFSIDTLSLIKVHTSNNRCVAIGNEPFSIAGAKLIGTGPNVLKFSTTSVTDAGGSSILPNIEWDNYSLGLTDAAYDVAGTMPLNPVTINPSSTQDFHFILQPTADPALLVAAQDAVSGAPIPNVAITITKGAFSKTVVTNHATVSETDWSGGSLTSQSGGIDVTDKPGSLTLFTNASGTYATGTSLWGISDTIDLGGSSSTLYGISWDPLNQPGGVGAGGLEFQIAANNDNTTWNFMGPDGTGNTYFTASSSSLPAQLSGNRYLRYEVFMSTQDGTVTPELDDISFDFTANCVPPAQALFTSLGSGNYTIDITAPNYAEGSSTVSVGAGFQSITVPLAHL